MTEIIIPVLITLVIACPITWFASAKYRKGVYEKKIGSAEDRSREIIDEALKVAENKKREALLEAKEENLKTWRRNPEREGQNFREWNVVCRTRRRLWIVRWTPWRSVRAAMQRRRKL